MGEGTGPVNSALSPDEDFIYTAQYTLGSWSVFPLSEDGTIGQGVDTPFKTTGSNETIVSRAHDTVVDPSGQFAGEFTFGSSEQLLNKWKVIPDLGLNVIHVARLGNKGATVLQKDGELLLLAK